MISKTLADYLLQIDPIVRQQLGLLEPDRYEHDLQICLDLIAKKEDYYCFRQRDPELADQLQKLGAKLVLTCYRQIPKKDFRARVLAEIQFKNLRKTDGLLTRHMTEKYPLGRQSKAGLMKTVESNLRLEQGELLYIYSRLLGRQLTLDRLLSGEQFGTSNNHGQVGAGVFTSSLELTGNYRYLLRDPIGETSTGVTFFNFQDEGLLLESQERILCLIPHQLCGSVLAEVYVLHRKPIENIQAMKSVTHQTDRQPFQYHDTQGAYLKIVAHQENTQVSEEHGALKFAEPRSIDQAEGETYQQWNLGPANAIELINLGSGESALTQVHQVEIQMMPQKEIKKVQQFIFTPGSRFPKLDNSSLVKEGAYQCGGGLNSSLVTADQIATQGYYPGAIQIGADRRGQKHKNQGGPVSVNQNGQLVVNLETGWQLEFVEVMIGDHQTSGSTVSTPQSSGAIFRGHLDTDRPGDFMIPPRPVVSQSGTRIRLGGPIQKNHIVVPGEHLILESVQGEPVYVLGLRILYS